MIENRSPEYEGNNTLAEDVKSLFRIYCKEHFVDKDIAYFDDLTFDEVLNKARNRNEWNEKLANYKEAEKKFIQMSAFNE